MSMWKRIAAAVLAALLLGLTACGSETGGLRLYYPAVLSARDKSTGGSDAITSTQVSWKKVTGDDRGRQQQAEDQQQRGNTFFQRGLLSGADEKTVILELVKKF